jgi:hypothetical protein
MALGAKVTKTYDLEGLKKGKVAKERRTTSATAMQSNSDAATPVQIKSSKVQKTMEIRLQQQRRASLTQPL